MERWIVPDLFTLADAIAAAGLNTFVVRRALQRMERGEITPPQAAQYIGDDELGALSRNGTGPYRYANTETKGKEAARDIQRNLGQSLVNLSMLITQGGRTENNWPHIPLELLYLFYYGPSGHLAVN